MNFHGFSNLTKETVMTKFDHENEDLIDLGAASDETKGVGKSAQDAILTQQQYPPMGLCAD
jgi:hypothetical protein